MKKDFIVISPCSVFSRNKVNDKTSPEEFYYIDQYALETTDFTPFKCMVINGFVDQDYLFEQRHLIREFLDTGKVLIFSGNLVTEWLPGGQMFIPKEIRSYKDYIVSIHMPHPIFEGVLEDDMTYNKGVSGFFARGHHPAPQYAEVLLTLPGGEPITYIDRQSSGGTIVAHVGMDLFSYMRSEEGKTTDRINGQLIEWVKEEFNRLQEGVKMG